MVRYFLSFLTLFLRSVHGIFDADPDTGLPGPGEILCVARTDATKDVIAVPGARNSLRLMRFPAVKGSKARVFTYHSSQITSLDFSKDKDDSLCFSAGGKDASLAQWLHRR